MPSFMYSTLEKIDKHNKYRNKQKLRRLEKVSDELLYVVEAKNNIIDKQVADIDRLHAIIKNHENTLASHSQKTHNTYDYMYNTTFFYCIIVIILTLLKSFL